MFKEVKSPIQVKNYIAYEISKIRYGGITLVDANIGIAKLNNVLALNQPPLAGYSPLTWLNIGGPEWKELN